jgi:glucokinase
MTLVLAGDIGGTKTLLYMVDISSGEVRTFKERYITRDYPDLVAMVKAFWSSCASRMDIAGMPLVACFGVAGPVNDGKAMLTNVDWVLDSDRLARELGIAQVSLINDFEAIAYGILTLREADLHCLQRGVPQPHAPIAVLGAGTGMGQAYLTWSGDHYIVHSSEGGHSDFAPQTPAELDLLNWLWQKYPQVSVELVVSGQGIVNIYEYFCSVHSNLPHLDLTDCPEPAALIARAARESGDLVAQQAMECFVSAYGSEAGNVAVKFLPYGGLYVAGGIAPKVLGLITQNDRFLQAMHRKEKMRNLLRDIPTYIVLNAEVGLMGALYQAKQMIG